MFTTESNDYHMRLKRGAVKAYSMDTVAGLEPYVDKCIAVLVARLREVTQSGAKPVSPVAWLQYFAFDVLGEINFSKDLGFLEKGADVDNIIAAVGGILTYVSLVSLRLSSVTMLGAVTEFWQIGQIPLAHKFLLGNPLLPKLFPAIEKTNQVLQFSLAQVEERQRKPGERKDLLNRLLDTHRTDPNSLTVDEIIAITTTNVWVCPLPIHID